MSTTNGTEKKPVLKPVTAASGLGKLVAAAQTGTNNALVSQSSNDSTQNNFVSGAIDGALGAVGAALGVTGKTKRTSGGSSSTPTPTNPYADQMSAAQSRLNTELPTYTDSYADRIATMEQSGPADYASKYQTQIDSALEALQNRKAFQYNMSSDPLYRQYAAMYAQQGKRAMQDTMGQAAALTGGYGSSYASTAGNQAYQQHLDQLNDRAVELAALARQNYDQEGSDMRANLSALQTAESQNRQNYESDRSAWYDQLAMLQQGQANEYQKYRDSVEDYWNNQNDAWNQYTYWNDKWAAMH